MDSEFNTTWRRAFCTNCRPTGSVDLKNQSARHVVYMADVSYLHRVSVGPGHLTNYQSLIGSFGDQDNFNSTW